jgi:hypothetical protein
MVMMKGRFRGVKQNLKRARAFWNRSFWKRNAEKTYLKKENKR